VRRSAFLQVGGFDPVVRFPGEEERVALDLADRGWQLSYRDDLVVHHHPSPRRDTAHRRRRALVRSLLLTACMRRPWRVVAAKTVTEWRSGTGRPGILAALPRLPAAVRYRRLLCAAVEDNLRRLEVAERAAAGTRPTRAEAAAGTAVRCRRTGSAAARSEIASEVLIERAKKFTEAWPHGQVVRGRSAPRG
jgi:hypothetical protein